MSKHLVDIDDAALEAARAELRTATIKDTINRALRRVASDREEQIRAGLHALADMRFEAREEAWR